jgi:hypothetical protein
MKPSHYRSINLSILKNRPTPTPHIEETRLRHQQPTEHYRGKFCTAEKSHHLCFVLRCGCECHKETA